MLTDTRRQQGIGITLSSRFPQQEADLGLGTQWPEAPALSRHQTHNPEKKAPYPLHHKALNLEIPPLAEDAAVSAPGIYTNTTPIPRPISFVSSPLPHPRARNGPSPPSPPCFGHVSTLSSPVLQPDEMAAKALNRHNNPSDGAKILPTLPAEITCQCPLPLVGKFPSPSEPPPRRGEISPVCAVACR